jgi:tripartite-type tricarboxylate transporter receptor subunit TctC
MAEVYPTRPVRIIVPTPPGGSNDLAARLMAEWLSERLGPPFVVENQPGIGTEAVVKGSPDGYTLLLVAPSHAINSALYEKLNFNVVRDIAPVASIISQPLIVLVNPSVPAKTIPELIAFAKANPGKVNMASPGNGTPNHVAGELFKMMTAVNMLHVPYRGSVPAVTDLLDGKAQVYFGAIASSIEYVKNGKLRLLAVTTAARSGALRDIPTVGEFVPGYEVSSWFGIGAPKNTPGDIVDKLNREINAALADPRMKARLADLGGTVLAGSPSDFGKLIADETEKWSKVVRAANIKAE